MGRKRYKTEDAAMWYKGVKVGTGTVAESDAYVVLLENCGRNPYEVLERYTYFSPNEKAALEKACTVYDSVNMS